MNAKYHIDKEHKCPICNAAFSLKQQVENHVRIHTGDTPYKCDECGQTFRTAQARGLNFQFANTIFTTNQIR